MPKHARVLVDIDSDSNNAETSVTSLRKQTVNDATQSRTTTHITLNDNYDAASKTRESLNVTSENSNAEIYEANKNHQIINATVSHSPHRSVKQMSLSSSEDDTNNNNNNSVEIMSVDFEFYDARDSDFHALRQYLSTFLDGFGDFDAGGLAALICEQVQVGTFVKCSSTNPNAEHPIAFISVIDLQKHKNVQCVKQIVKYILSRCQDDATKDKLKHLLSLSISGVSNDSRNHGERVGLIIQQRMPNAPLDLVPDLHQALCDDLLWAEQHYGTAFTYDTLIMLERSDVHHTNLKSKRDKRNKKQKRATSLITGERCNSDKIVYHHFECEMYAQASTLNTSFTTHWTNDTLGRKLSTHRSVLCIPRAQLACVCDNIRTSFVANAIRRRAQLIATNNTRNVV